MWAKIILANSRSRESARLTLVAMGLCANRDGFVAVATDTLASLCGVLARQIRRDIASLIELGELDVVEKGGGRGKLTTYLITVSRGTLFPKLETVSSTKGVYRNKKQCPPCHPLRSSAISIARARALKHPRKVNGTSKGGHAPIADEQPIETREQR